VQALLPGPRWQRPRPGLRDDGGCAHDGRCHRNGTSAITPPSYKVPMLPSASKPSSAAKQPVQRANSLAEVMDSCRPFRQPPKRQQVRHAPERQAPATAGVLDSQLQPTTLLNM
jgi:hypothetical protein